MMQDIKYAIQSIKESSLLSVIFMIQMIVILFLFADSTDNIITFQKGVERFQYMEDNQAYVNADTTDDKQLKYIWNHEKESIKKARELYSFIKENNETYTVWTYQTDYSAGGKPLMEYFTDELFFEMLDLKLCRGDLEAETTKGVTPVIIGYELKDMYELDEEYEIFDHSLNEDRKIKVVGVLEQDSTIPSLYEIGCTQTLNYAILFPITEEYLNDLANLDMAINSTVVFSGDEAGYTNIEDKSAQLNLFSMKYNSMQSNINDYLEILENKLENRFLTIVIIAIFSISSMSLNMLTLIAKKKKDFAIHIMLGATKQNIIRQIICQILILFIPAVLIAGVCYGFTNVWLYSIFFSSLLTLIVVIVPIIKIYKTNIIVVYQRGDY